jgi:LysM repeat protein
MSKEDPYRDQAEKLRKKIEKTVDAKEVSPKKEELPPRSRLHREKRKKNKWKIKYPVIRLLALFFILLPITIFSMYQYLSNENGGTSDKVNTDQKGFETVGFEEEEENKGTKIEEREVAPETEETAPEEKKETKDENVTIPPPRNPVLEDKQDKGQIEKEEPKVIRHTVKPNETIYRIAMTYYKSKSGIDIIKKANNLQSNEIRVGQVLVIPK